MAKVRDKMQKKLAKYIAFQHYLDKVLEKAEEVVKKYSFLPSLLIINFINEPIN